MSLDFSFFEERNKQSESYLKNGFVDLDDFLQQHDLNLLKCFDADLLVYSFMKTTAELHDYKLTPLGKKFILRSDYQLFLVKPDMKNELLELLNNVTSNAGSSKYLSMTDRNVSVTL